MPCFLGIVFVWTKTCREIIRPVLVHLYSIMKYSMFNILPLLLRIINNLYHLETFISHTTDLKLRARSGEKIACTVWWHKRKANHQQNWNIKTLDHQGKGSRQKAWIHMIAKKNLPGRALSPSVLFRATMSSKTKLKLNWLIKFSSWSANWLLFLREKEKKRKYVLTWHLLST